MGYRKRGTLGGCASGGGQCLRGQDKEFLSAHDPVMVQKGGRYTSGVFRLARDAMRVPDSKVVNI